MLGIYSLISRKIFLTHKLKNLAICDKEVYPVLVVVSPTLPLTRQQLSNSQVTPLFWILPLPAHNLCRLARKKHLFLRSPSWPCLGSSATLFCVGWLPAWTHLPWTSQSPLSSHRWLERSQKWKEVVFQQNKVTFLIINTRFIRHKQKKNLN